MSPGLLNKINSEVDAMVNESSQPKPGDAVLGGNNPPPINAAVLGGIEGAKQRCASTDFQARIAGLREAVKYGEAGIELLLHGLKDEVSEVAWVAYSLLLENAEPELKRALEIYNFYPRNYIRTLTHDTAAVTYDNQDVTPISFSPNWQLFACGAPDAIIKLWDVKTNALRATLSGHSGLIRHIAFSPNGQLLASSSVDKTIKLWDVETGTVRATLSGHSNVIAFIAFSPNGELLASGGGGGGRGDATIKLWDVETGTLTATLSGYSDVFSIAFSPNGELLANQYWGTIDLLDVKTGARTASLSHNVIGRGSNCFAFSPRGKLLASGTQQHTIDLWDVKTGKLTATLSGHSDYIHSLAFSPNGQLLASKNGSNTIKLWNVETGTLIDTLSTSSSGVKYVAFSPNGQLLAGGSNRGTTNLWGAEISNLNIIDPVALFHSYLEIKQPQNSSLYKKIKILNTGTKSEKEAAFLQLKGREEPLVKAVLWSYICAVDPKVVDSRKLLKYFLALDLWQEAQEETESIFLQELGCTGVEGINDTSKIKFLSAIYKLWAIYAKVEPQVDFFKALKMRIEHLNNMKAENARINAESRANNSEVYITRSHAMMDDL
jgi:WD40 repeat protein